MIYKLIFFLLFLPLISMGQSNPNFWNVYNSTNTTIFSDNLGAIYFSPDSTTFFLGSIDGLEEWDTTGTNFYHHSYPNVPGRSISSIEPFENGLFLQGLESGVFYVFDSNNYELNSSNSPLPDNGLSDLKVLPNGDLYISSRGNGLFIYKNQNWIEYNTFNSNIPSYHVGGISIADSNTIYFSSENGFCLLEDDSIHYFEISDTTNENKFYWEIFYDDRLNSVWGRAGSFEGFFRYDFTHSTIHKYLKADLNIPSDIIAKFIYGPFGNLWLGTHDGLAIMNTETEEIILHFNELNSGLPHHQVYDIWFDPNKAEAWFATWGGGLAKWEYGKDPEFMAVMNGTPTKKPAKINIRQEGNSLSLQNLLPKSKVSIFNIKGQLINTTLSNSNSLVIQQPSLISGVYLLKVEHEKGTTSQKFVFTQNH